MIHIGQRIREVFEQEPKSHNIEWFAAQLSCKRANVYNIFNRQALDTDLLGRICRVLHHDFFLDLSDSLEIEADNGKLIRNKAILYKEMMQDISRSVTRQISRARIGDVGATFGVINRHEESDSIFPISEFRIVVRASEGKETKEHIHIQSVAQNFDLRVDLNDGSLISIKRRGKRDKTDTFADVIGNAATWLDLPSKIDSRRTNRQVALDLYQMLNG